MVILSSCKKNEECNIETIDTFPSFTEPAWSPDGKLLVFNHRPLAGINRIDRSPCSPEYIYTYKDDSTGFWLIHKDGTSLRRVLTFQLLNPAWSPDGKWIAFCNGGIIYKMAFDGNNFDSSHIVALTTGGANHFYPSWSPLGDSIYYDSDQLNTSKPYQVYKMAADGTGQSLIGDKGMDSIYSREPFCTKENQILHVRGDSLSYYVFSMNSEGGDVKQLTKYYGGGITNIEYPRSFNKQIFYENHGIWTLSVNGPSVMKVIENTSQGYSISVDGTIAYINFDQHANQKLDKLHGCLWLANLDGSNQRPFVINAY